jgi:LysM repeat protein
MALDGYDPAISAPGAFGTEFSRATADHEDGFFQIEQIEGSASERIEVVLSGRAMPYQGVEFGGEQRRKRTNYPGNPVATHQILGPAEDDTTIGGMWKDRYITNSIAVNGDVSQIQTAEQAVHLFHSLRRAGKRVRVQWLSEVRAGLIASFTPKWIRGHDVEWTVVFEWSAFDDEVAYRVAAEQPPASEALNRMNDLEDIFTLIPNTAARLEASLVEAIHSVRDRVQKVFGVLRAVETVVNLPATVLGTLKADVDSLRNELLEFNHRLAGPRSSTYDAETSSRIKFGAASSALMQRGGVGSPAMVGEAPGGFAVRTSANAAGNAVANELAFEAWKRSTARAGANLLYTVQRQVAALESRRQPATTRVHQVKQGETLYAIAADAYGSPDFANFLANANRLQSVLLPPGTLVRIPPRPFGSTVSIEPIATPLQACNGG